MEREVLIDYIDEDGNKKNGYFKLVKESITGLTVKGNKNTLIIPHSKLNRVKYISNKNG